MHTTSFRPASCLLSLGLALAAVGPAAAQTYLYNGPFTGTGSTANPWSTDSWVPGTPVSSATTQLVFPNFNTSGYSANNDLGNPFQLNAATLRSFSTVNTTVSSATGNSLQLTGVNPTSPRPGRARLPSAPAAVA